MYVVKAKTGRVMGRYATKAEAEARTAQLARQAEALKAHRFGKGAGRGRRAARSPSGMSVKSIGGGDYQVSDAAAGSLARAAGKKLPAVGYELSTEMPNGAAVWLRRVAHRHAPGAPKRGWVWIVALRRDADHQLLHHYAR